MSLCRDLIVQLTHRAGAQIARILVFRAVIIKGLIDLFKVAVGNYGLSAQYQPAAIRDFKRQIGKDSGVSGNDLADFSVAARDRLDERAVLIGQHNRQPVQLPRKHTVPRAEPLHQRVNILRLI